MVSSSPHKKDVAANTSLNKRAITLVSGPQPLIKHKFYLDIKNHITSSKLETKIKQLGGNLELFLVKEVTHIVTDREGWSSCNKGGGTNPDTPRTPLNQSLVHNEHGTPGTTPKRGRPKTRVDAMLEKARRTSTVIIKDPLVQGKSWGITIWPVEKANCWLDKVQLKTETKKSAKPKIRELQTPYIKFEAFDRKHRAVFSEIRSLSILNIKGDAGSSGLTYERVDRNMTRKPRPSQPPRIEAVEPLGYCEVCRVQYIGLDDHLKSKEHIAFGQDNSNFIELDDLINDGTNLKALIDTMKSEDRKLNGMNGRHRSPVMAKIVRRRANSICKIDKALLNSVEKELKAKRKSRTKTSSSKYTDDSADEGSPVINPDDSLPIRELRSSYRKALKKIAEQESNTWSSGRPKRSCINKQKRISVDNNVVSENKGYYKIEKPKSSSPVKEQEEPIKKKSNNSNSEDKQGKPLVFKFKKMRWSELKRLNNEAVNFLFPKKEESSSEEDIDADAPNTTVSTQNDESSMVISSDNEKHDDEHSMDSISSESSQVKKKRRTQAEKFIWDNMKYYKFETPDSRLRYHGSLLPEVIKPSKNNGEICTNITMDVTPEIKPDAEESGKKCFNLNNIKFAFEIIPKSEPWYQTFSRQDNGEEYYTCYSDSGCWKPRLLLPYEMGPLPPLNPQTCISQYKQLKKQIVDDFKSSSCSGSCSTPDGSSNDASAAETSKSVDDLNASEESMDETKPVTKVPKKRGRKPKGSRPPLPPGKNPRKSPRQHASTLAILGNLMHRKRSRGRPPLEPIPEAESSFKETTNTKKVQHENEALAKSIDDMLNNAVKEVIESEPLDIPVDDDINLRLRVSVVDILEDYESFIQSDDKSNMVECTKRGASPGKKTARKRKKNRTGWPNKNNRKSVKKEPNSTEVKLNGDDKIVDEVNDSVANSVNIEDQSNDNCVNKTHSEIIEIDDRVKVSDVRNSDCVVDLDRWENAEKILAAKMNDVNNDLLFQPYVRVQKLDDNGIKNANKRLRESSSPHRTTKKSRRMPGSPKSPRVLRKPRGRWYRER